MKTSLILSAITVGFFCMTSCEKKDHETIVNTKVINVELKQNESYSYTILPSGDEDDAMEISLQAQHALKSEISPSLERTTVFNYTPAVNFIGSDEVHINTTEGEHHDGEHHGGDNHDNNMNGEHHGNCQGKNHGTENETNYIFKITITGTTPSVSNSTPRIK